VGMKGLSLKKFNHIFALVSASVVLAACMQPTDPTMQTGEDLNQPLGANNKTARQSAEDRKFNQELELRKVDLQEKKDAEVAAANLLKANNDEERNAAQAANDAARIAAQERTDTLRSNNDLAGRRASADAQVASAKAANSTVNELIRAGGQVAPSLIEAGWKIKEAEARNNAQKAMAEAQLERAKGESALNKARAEDIEMTARLRWRDNFSPEQRAKEQEAIREQLQRQQDSIQRDLENAEDTLKAIKYYKLTDDQRAARLMGNNPPSEGVLAVYNEIKDSKKDEVEALEKSTIARIDSGGVVERALVTAQRHPALAVDGAFDDFDTARQGRAAGRTAGSIYDEHAKKFGLPTFPAVNPPSPGAVSGRGEPTLEDWEGDDEQTGLSAGAQEDLAGEIQRAQNTLPCFGVRQSSINPICLEIINLLNQETMRLVGPIYPDREGLIAEIDAYHERLSKIDMDFILSSELDGATDAEKSMLFYAVKAAIEQKKQDLLSHVPTAQNFDKKTASDAVFKAQGFDSYDIVRGSGVGHPSDLGGNAGGFVFQGGARDVFLALNKPKSSGLVASAGAQNDYSAAYAAKTDSAAPGVPSNINTCNLLEMKC